MNEYVHINSYSGNNIILKGYELEQKKDLWPLVLQQTISTKRPLLLGEV
jgi:hypothetical protein